VGVYPIPKEERIVYVLFGTFKPIHYLTGEAGQIVAACIGTAACIIGNGGYRNQFPSLFAQLFGFFGYCNRQG